MKKLILILFSVLNTTIFAAAGDDCSTAILVSANGCSTAGAYNNTGIVGTLAPPACFGGGNNNGMWFKFIASGPVVNVTVNGGTLASPMIGLFSSTGACVSPFTELGCTNPGGTTASLPYSALVAGNTYYIYVDGANNNVGTFQLCLTSPAQPANDDPCNAITLPTSNFCSGPNAYTTVGATAENLTSTFIPPCFDNPGTWNSVWYKFTAVGTTAVISINGGIVRPQVALIELTGLCSGTGFNNFGCSQAASGNTTTLTVANVVPGNTYYIVVDGFSSNTGSFEICLNNYNPSSTVINDQCSNATILCPNNHYYATTAGATPLNDPAVNQWSCNGVVDNTVWFKFTTTNPVQAVSFAINGTCTGDALQFEVFRKTATGDPCATTNQWSSVGCNNSINPNGSAVLNLAAASLLPATDYYIVVDNWPGRSCNFDFTITGNQGAYAATDQTVCANAAAFTLPGFSPAGGTWSGPGVTPAGVFNPTTAGIGTHLLYYTYGACTDTKTIKVTGPTVNVSNSVSVCPGTCTTLLGDATQPQVIVSNPSFSNTNDFAIPDNNTTGITSSVTVSGLSSSASLQSICLNITHPFDGDVDIFLRCPNGTTLELATDLGGGGDNFTNTCFNLTSAVNISSGSVPFNAGTGYIPEGGPLSTLSGCAVNGTWALIVKDDGVGDVGTLTDWTMTFNNTVINTIPATSFTWSPATAMTGGTTLSPTVCPVSTTVYSLTGTDANGCTATDATTVTVTPLTVTVTPTQNICAGVSTTLTAGGATSYTWSPATGLSSTTGAVVVANPTITTTYTVVGAQGACTNTQVVTVNVTTPTLAVVTPTYCTGSSGALSVSGAVTYTWAPATGLSSSTGATVTANPTVSTTYTVSGTLANGCVGTQTALVTVNPKPLVSLTFTNPTCGNNNGVVVVTDIAPISPPQSLAGIASSLGTISGMTVTGLGAGSPVITATNNFGCTYTVSTTLTMTPFPTGIPTTTTSASCGLSNGSLSFSTTSGVSPYTYSVNNNAATSPTTGLIAGTYTVKVQDFNGCTYSITATIPNATGPTAIAGSTTMAGCSLNNGSYNVTGVTGGSPTYSFGIDGGAVSTTSLMTGLSPGNHTVLVRDANSCTYTTAITIPSATGPTTATIGTSLATCGTANGSATISAVVGGSPTYSFSFNNGPFSTTSTIGSLAAGTHTVIIKDANSCTLTINFTINNNGSPTSTITGATNPMCAVGSNTATGSFSVSASGGSGAPFTYTLTQTGTVNGTGVFTGLPQGTYNITIRDGAGCTTSNSVVLTPPPVLTLTTSSIPAKCFGASSGTISVSGAGGTPTYSYNLNGGGYQSSSSFNNVGAAIYNIGIMDLNGCVATQTIQVTQPTALSQTMTTTNANCTAANGTATTSVSGGTSPYFYSWTGGAGSMDVTNPVVSGTYTVTITDANTCTLTGVANIGATISGTAVITGSTNITCFNASNGSITAAMPGGSPIISYTWSPLGGNAATASNLPAGTYTCFTSDAFGCTSSVQATLAQPTQLSVNMTSNNAKCFNTPTGTVSASGSGGVTPYTYLWSNTSTLTTVSGVGQGTYTVTVTDFNNCQVSGTVTVNQPTAISLTSATTAATCNQANGSATVTPSGGVGGYTYNWSPASTSTTSAIGPILAGTYTVTVTDVNGCSQVLSTTIPNLSGPSIGVTSSTNVSCFGGNNGAATTTVSGGTGLLTFTWSPSNQFTQNATGLLMGIHTVTVTDQAGCIASTSVNITQPTVLTASIIPTDPKCNGATNGFGLVNANGGTSPYTYAWATGSGTAATSPQYGAGNYGVTVTDALGCTVISTMTLNNPLAMSVAITSTSVTCFGACNGVAIGSATNNVGPVSYNWTGVGIAPITTQTLSGLCAGTYSLQAVDMNGCTATNQVTINQPTQVTANISATGSITCNGGNDGFATVTPGGGVGGYTFQWTASTSTVATANSLTAGPYTVTVTDANNCSAIAIATIIEPTPLSTTLTTANPKCNAVCNGTANVAYLGGAGTTTFLWLPGLQSGNNVSTLCAGAQSVVITSNGSCTTAITFTLTEPSPLTATLTATDSHCTQSDGSACAVVTGGTAPYQSTMWSNGVSTVCNNSIPAGAYTFTVTDANGCALVESASINDIAGPTVVITGSTAVKCYGESNGTANTTISGGTGSLSIVWTNTSPQITTANTTSLNAGPHSIIVTDQAGCVGTDALTMTQPNAILSAIGSQTNVTCFGLSNGGATLLANGGTPNYSYSWTPSGQISDILGNVGAGVHTCTITDQNGCTKTETVSITEPAPVVMTNSVITNVNCNGGSDGQIATTVVGGSGSFSYSWSPTEPNSPAISGLPQGTYSLVVTDTRSCSISANFTVLEPSALVTTSNTAVSTCGLANGSATVGVTGGTSPYTMFWNTPTVQTGSTAISLPPNSNWICTITDGHNCSTQQTVTIGSAPSPTITGFVKTNPSCFGYQDGTLQVNYTSGTPDYQVAWSSPISQTITTSSTSHSVGSIPAGNYVATVTDDNGCVASMPVSVTQPTLLLLSAAATNTNICFGQTTQLSASTSGGTSPYSYTWTPVAGTGVGPGPHTVTLTTTTIFDVKVTDSKNCPALAQQITVAVTPSLEIAGKSFTVCEGDQVLLTPTMVRPGRGAPYDFTWDIGQVDNNVAISTTTVTGALPTPNNYTVTIEDGCTNQTPKASAIFTVIVNPKPVIDFAAVAPGCAPLTFTLNGTPVGNTFEWSIPEIGAGYNGNNISVTLSDTGKFDLKVKVTNSVTGCWDTLRKINHIEVYPVPVASFAAIPPIGSILEPTITFTNTSIGATSYYWDFGDPVATSGSNNSELVDPVHTYSLAGEYEVHLVATNDRGCRDIAKVPVEIKPDFALYIPNTFTPDGNGLNDFFQPQGIGINEDNYRLDIFDRWGENIFTSNSFRKGWDGTVKGNSKLAEQGVYVYKVMVYDLQGNKHPFVGHVTLIRQNEQ